MIKPQTILGFVWQDVFGGVHTAGKVLATAFAGQAGAGLADSAADLENKGGLLPGWAGGTQPQQATPTAQLAPQVTVIKPDYVIFARQSGKVDNPVKGVAYVVVTGGSRIAGNGYKPGAASSQFSFAYSNPQRIDIVLMNGASAAGIDIATAVFGGGTEQQGAPQAPTTVQGDVMANPYAYGAQVLGAARGRSTRMGVSIATSKTGKQFTIITPSRRGSVRTVVMNAQDIGKNAVMLANRIKNALRKTTIVGAGKKVTVHAVRKHQANRVQLLAIANDLAASGQKLLAASSKLDQKAAATDLRQKAGMMRVQAKMFSTAAMRGANVLVNKSASRASRAATRRSQVLGELVDYLDTQIIGDDGSSDGTDGSTDAAPSTASMAASTVADSSSSDSSGGGGSVPGPNDNNYGVGPAPTVQTVLDGSNPFSPTYGNQYGAPDPGWTTDDHVYNSKTDGAQAFAGVIYYEGDYGTEMPRDKVGSFNRYYGPDAGGKNGGSGYYWAGGSDGWVQRYVPPGADTYTDSRRQIPADDLLSHVNLITWDVPNPYTPGVNHQSINVGPLVGAPGDWTEGLRFDMGTRSWFWFWNKAPKTAAKVAQAGLLLDQAMADYNTALTAAKTNYAAQQAQDLLDAQQAREVARQTAKDQANLTSSQVAVDIAQNQADAADAAAQQKYNEQMAQLDVQERQQMLSPDGGDMGDESDYVDQDQIVDDGEEAAAADEAQDMLDNSPAPDAETPDSLDDVEGLVEGKGYY